MDFLKGIFNCCRNETFEVIQDEKEASLDQKRPPCDRSRINVDLLVSSSSMRSAPEPEYLDLFKVYQELSKTKRVSTPRKASVRRDGFKTKNTRKLSPLLNPIREVSELNEHSKADSVKQGKEVRETFFHEFTQGQEARNNPSTKMECRSAPHEEEDCSISEEVQSKMSLDPKEGYYTQRPDQEKQKMIQSSIAISKKNSINEEHRCISQSSEEIPFKTLK